MPENEWVTPSTYEEFASRFPNFIRQFVQKRVTDPDVRDRTEKEAVAYLSSPPKTRDYTDRFKMLIATNPDATCQDFFVWLTFCLSWISVRYQPSPAPGPAIETRLRINEFRAYVHEREPSLLALMDAIGSHKTYAEAQAALGFSAEVFQGRRDALGKLHQQFLKTAA